MKFLLLPLVICSNLRYMRNCCYVVVICCLRACESDALENGCGRILEDEGMNQSPFCQETHGHGWCSLSFGAPCDLEKCVTGCQKCGRNFKRDRFQIYLPTDVLAARVRSVPSERMPQPRISRMSKIRNRTSEQLPKPFGYLDGR